MKESNKESRRWDTRLHRIVRYLLERLPNQGRIVYGQVLRGVAFGAGSGAVSLLILWWENRS